MTEDLPINPNVIRSFDGRDWARAFMKAFGHRRHEIDEDVMVGWFANAIIRGWAEWDDDIRRLEVTDDYGDGLLFRLWIQLASSNPSKVAVALAKCAAASDYRAALTKLAKEAKVSL